MTVPTVILVSALVILALLVLWRKNNLKHGSYPLPPGPKPKIIVGNALDFPAHSAHRAYRDWGRKCKSDIVHASAFGNHVIVINSLKVADDLFEKRAELYNDRPDFAVRSIIDWDYVVALMRSGERWRRHRKVAHQLFRSAVADQYQHIQVQEVRRYLRNLVDSPVAFDKHSKMLSVAIPLRLCFGFEPDSVDDPIIQISDRVALVGLTLVHSLINIFPILRHVPSWVPGATSKKLGAEVNKWTVEMKRIPIDKAKRDCETGRAKPSIMTNFYDKHGTKDFPQEEETVLRNISYTAYTGAADTTISATGSLLYVLATHPEIQRKAQVELDAILGYGHRLPDYSDRPSLPYIEAIYRELLRAYPPFPLSIPHSLTEDDVYDGYFLPKGSTILGNIWAMNHDDSVYADPFDFKPERFIDENGKISGDGRVMAYGFGRRVCVGKAVASNTMWLTIASLIACFNIGPAKDKDGRELKIDGSFIEYGAALHKKPFECSITPRSQRHKLLIDTTAD